MPAIILSRLSILFMNLVSNKVLTRYLQAFRSVPTVVVIRACGNAA